METAKGILIQRHLFMVATAKGLLQPVGHQPAHKLQRVNQKVEEDLVVEGQGQPGHLGAAAAAGQ